MKEEKYIQVVERWTSMFGKFPTIGQKVRLRPDFEYYKDWPEIDYFLIGFYPSKYYGAEFTLSDSMEDHKESASFYLKDVMPVLEENIPADATLDIFASRSLQVYFALAFRPDSAWQIPFSEYVEIHDIDFFINEESQKLAQVMLSEKASRSEDDEVAPLDKLALLEMHNILVDACLTNARIGEYGTWAQMIASLSYAKAEEMLKMSDVDVKK